MTPPLQPDPAEIAKGLSAAQRDVMRGHLVEITPDESDQLIELGLKLPVRYEKVTIEKLVWPITDAGLAVRAIIEQEG